MSTLYDPKVETRLIEALSRLGVASWHTRGAIAESLGKSRLNVSEVAALDRLANSGRIQQRVVAATNPLLNRYEYSLEGQS